VSEDETVVERAAGVITSSAPMTRIFVRDRGKITPILVRKSSGSRLRTITYPFTHEDAGTSSISP